MKSELFLMFWLALLIYCTLSVMARSQRARKKSLWFRSFFG